jgi:hypothetical protein
MPDAQAKGTILNDDPIPTLSIFGSSVREGDIGTVNASVGIQLSNTSSLPITFNLLTTDGTAVGGPDFVASDTLVTVPPGTQSFTAVVQVRGDTVDERNESFFVNAYNATNATVNVPQTQVTILDDDSTLFDFDADGKSDIGIYRPSAGEWWYQKSSNGQVTALRFGASDDAITPADFTGDGRTDIAFFRPSVGQWFVLRSENFSYYSLPFGLAGDVPAPGDYDNDGKADIALFRPSNSTWYILQSSNGQVRFDQFGLAGDVPVAADYDADGKTDVAIYRPSVGQWWINRSTAGLTAFQFGNSTDKPVQGDYTGDGKADAAFWRPSTGEWFVARSEDNGYYSQPFGANGDVPSPGDYDGDGRFDTTVFRPADSTWYIQGSTAGTQFVRFGTAGDKPVANAFVP